MAAQLVTSRVVLNFIGGERERDYTHIKCENIKFAFSIKEHNHSFITLMTAILFLLYFILVNTPH
jgi:hypothetical protein